MFSKAWGPGLERAESGQPTEFYIKAYNSSGEPLPIGGENWEVTISGSTNGTMKPPVRDNGDGTYTVRYMAPNPGQIQIAVSLKTDRGRGPWAPLKDSPFLVNVAATPADANLSRVFGPGIEDGVEAGIPTYFNIEARDGKGDRIPWVRLLSVAAKLNYVVISFLLTLCIGWRSVRSRHHWSEGREDSCASQGQRRRYLPRRLYSPQRRTDQDCGYASR